MHRALGQATRWGMVPRNVAGLVDSPPMVRHEMRTLNPDEAKAFLQAAGGDRLEALYVLALTTGMRQGELFRLRWQDVDLEAHTLSVRGETKTAKSRRQIELSDVAVDALRRHAAYQGEECQAAGSVWHNTGLVLTNSVGGSLTPTNVTFRSFRPLLERAGLPLIRFHDLRHSAAATLLLGQGVHPKVVSEMLGHSQVGVTLDLSSHVTPTMHRQAVTAFDELLRS